MDVGVALIGVAALTVHSLAPGRCRHGSIDTLGIALNRFLAASRPGACSNRRNGRAGARRAVAHPGYHGGLLRGIDPSVQAVTLVVGPRGEEQRIRRLLLEAVAEGNAPESIDHQSVPVRGA